MKKVFNILMDNVYSIRTHLWIAYKTERQVRKHFPENKRNRILNGRIVDFVDAFTSITEWENN